MKKLVMLSALALAFTGAAYAKDESAGGKSKSAAGADSSFGQSTAGTAKAGDMDGKAQAADAQMTHQKGMDDRGKHLAKGKSKDKEMGKDMSKDMGKHKGEHKGEMHDKKDGKKSAEDKM